MIGQIRAYHIWSIPSASPNPGAYDPYSIHEAERKGVTFTFKAERPGIYLIHARWWNNNQEEPI